MNFSDRSIVSYLSILIAIISGFFVFLVLSYLFVNPKISTPISIIMVTLIFGLTRYYSTSYEDKQHVQSIRAKETKTYDDGRTYPDDDNRNQSWHLISFVSLYAIVLIISTFVSKSDSDLFLNWSDIGIVGIIQLGAAIMLSFFMPGYAFVLIAAKERKINPILKVLLAYLISVLISGSIGYIMALYFDIAISESKNVVLGINLVILIGFVFSYLINGIKLNVSSKSRYAILDKFISYLSGRIWKSVKAKNPELFVFGSLFMLLLVYTYYVFGGVTIGDQWYHQGRALLFLSGSIQEAAVSYADAPYPPLQSALLAIVAATSGMPIVNTYASMAIINMTPVFAFYYFFSTWIPFNMQRSKILASTLFAIGSGFGWMYILGMTVTTHPAVSQRSVLDTLVSAKPFDVFQPTNFFLTAHPEVSTGLIYIALPAGFVLLGILKENLPSKFIFTIAVTAISVLGVLSHDEFYFFIIVGSILPLLFKVKQGNCLYLGFLFATAILYLVDITSPAKYYTFNEIFPGAPLLGLNAIFVGITWTLYLVKNKLRRLQAVQRLLVKFRLKANNNRCLHSTRVRFFTGLLVVSIACYIYGLSIIILAHLSTNDIIIQTAGHGGPYNIPWYLYSLKLGVTGLLGLSFVLSYLFKKFEKEIFVFGIIIIIALLAGPYYDEHRFSKYIMVGMVGFASLLVYKIINSLRSFSKPVIGNIIIGIIIITATLSSILYIGYNSLILETEDFVSTLGRRNFPISEMPLLQTLHDKMDIGSNRYNILTFPNEYSNFDDGLMAKLQGFSGLPDTAVYQNPLTLNVSTLDGFYRLLEDSGTRYIIIPKSSINETLRLTEPVRFALDHFQSIYEDSKYVVLDVPSLKSPSSSNGTDTAVIYEPIKIGNLSRQKYEDVTRYYQYYYPLSTIALSKFGYDLFMDTDLSAFSKKQIVLTFDPSHWDDAKFNRYIEYVSNGGTVIIMGSDNFKGRFGQLFSIKPNDNNQEVFTKIVGENNQFLNISGLVKGADIMPSPDTNVVSTYRDNENRAVAPFAIEKHFSNGGRIVLVNSEGYFNALSKLPKQYFQSLSNISKLLDLDGAKLTAPQSDSQDITAKAKRLIGEFKVIGNITANSSSLLLLDEDNNSYNIHAERISILNKSNNKTEIFNDVTIKDLILTGKYEAAVNSSGTSIMPGKNSQHGYIRILIPSGLNLTVNIDQHKSSYGEIVTINRSSLSTIGVTNGSIITFYKMSIDPSQEYIPVLMKSPEIKVSGQIDFKDSNFDRYFPRSSIRINEEGWINAKVSFVDDYEQSNLDGSKKLQYLTFFQSIENDREIDRGEVTINLPGEISNHAKRHGPHIPLKEALLSVSNIILLISLIVITTVGSWLTWPKIKPQM